MNNLSPAETLQCFQCILFVAVQIAEEKSSDTSTDSSKLLAELNSSQSVRPCHCDY